ncbi:MAG: TolB family protein [Vicinamibacterales bacterium]
MQLALAETGVVVYVPAATAQRTLVWVDRQRKETPVGLPVRAYSHPRVSPDGARILVTMRDRGLDVYVWDVARAMLRQLTFDPMPNYTAVWLDSHRLAFWARGTSSRPQVSTLAADGSSGPRQLTNDANLPTYPVAASRDGKLLLVTEITGEGNNIGVIPIENPEKRRPRVIRGTNPVLSPNSQWLAYESGKTGRQEIYVRLFPETFAGVRARRGSF